MSADVQHVGIQSVGSVASLSKAFASNVTAGNSILVGAVSSVTNWAAGNCTDGLSNTYTMDVSTTASGARVAVYRSHNIAGGSCTVTIDCTGSDFQSIAIEEVSGLNNAAPENTNSGSASSVNANSGNCVLSTSGFIFGVMSHDGATTSITPVTFYLDVFTDTDASDMPIGAASRVVAAGTFATAWTLGASRLWHACDAAYQDAAAGETITVDKWYTAPGPPTRQKQVTVAY